MLPIGAIRNIARSDMATCFLWGRRFLHLCISSLSRCFCWHRGIINQRRPAIVSRQQQQQRPKYPPLLQLSLRCISAKIPNYRPSPNGCRRRRLYCGPADSAFSYDQCPSTLPLSAGLLLLAHFWSLLYEIRDFYRLAPISNDLIMPLYICFTKND